MCRQVCPAPAALVGRRGRESTHLPKPDIIHDSRPFADRPMQPSEALSTVALVSVTVAGFSGVVAVFGGGPLHEWPRTDRFRLGLLLLFSLSPLALSLLGMSLEAAALPQSAIWRSASAVAAVVFLAAGMWNMWQFIHFPKDELRSAGASRAVFYGGALAGLATCALQVYNSAALGRFWPFMAVLAVSLVVATLQFARLVLNRPGHPRTGSAAS